MSFATVRTAPRRLNPLRPIRIADRRWLLAGLLIGLASVPLRAGVEAGPAWHDYKLTLLPGSATEGFGPVWGREKSEGSSAWRLSPLISHYADTATERSEYEVLYPAFTYDRFGTEYALHFLQFFQINGSSTVDDESKKRTTLFPIFFRQKSSNPTNDYFALLPLYGHLRNRLFRDEVHFVLAPLWVSSVKRDVQTDNVLFPIFHRRHGNGVHGWQAWPLIGSETKEITYRLNNLDEQEVVPGHRRQFFALPFFIREETGLGTENAVTNRFAFPAYGQTRSPAMDFTSVLLFTYRTNRQEKFSEWSAPWPFIGAANGPGKTARRFWPFFGHAKSPSQSSDFALWPLYTRRSTWGDNFRRNRTRLLYFGYSDTHLTQPGSTQEFRRRDLWPFFTYRHDLNGQTRLQVLALAEPLLPNNKSFEPLYAPVWSLYRAEYDPKTEQASQSLLWNLWRRDVEPGVARTSCFFGAVKTEKTDQGRKWHFFKRRPAKTISPPKDPAPQP